MYRIPLTCRCRSASNRNYTNKSLNYTIILSCKLYINTIINSISITIYPIQLPVGWRVLEDSLQQDTSTCWNTRTPLDRLPKRQGYLTDASTVSTVASTRIWHCFLASPLHSISVLHWKFLDASRKLGHPSSGAAASALCAQNRARCQLTERSSEQLHCIHHICLSIVLQ